MTALLPEEARQEFWLPAVFVDYQNLVVDPKDREGSRISTAASTWSRRRAACVERRLRVLRPGDTSRQYKAPSACAPTTFRHGGRPD